MTVTSANRNFGLDLFRAVAILMVLIWHTSAVALLPRPLYSVAEFFGFFGVELFFVLSGFLIGGILIRELTSNGSAVLFSFWQRRWQRTLPNYFLFLVLNSILAAFVFGESVYPWLYIIFAQNLVRPIPGFFGESWSLAVEEWFYLLLPLAALAFRRIRKDHAVLYGSAVLAVASILLRAYLAAKHPEWSWRFRVRKVALARFDSLFFGVLLAHLKNSSPKLWSSLQSRGYAISGLIVAIAISFIETRATLFTTVAIFTFASLAVALMLPFAYALPRSKAGRVVSVPITFISLVSYSVYLINEPLLAALRWGRAPEFFGVAGFCLLYWFLTFTLAAFVYQNFERRFMHAG